MIAKHRNRPLDIHLIQAIQRRLPKDLKHDPFLEEQLNIKMAGFKGEKELDYVLEGIRYDFPDCLILQDLRLATGENHVQIDTLVLTRKGVFLLEVKHMNGLVRLDRINRQMIQTRDGHSRILKDPFGQMATARRKFVNWFTANRMRAPKVFQLLIFTNDQMELDASSTGGFARKWDVIDAMIELTQDQQDILKEGEIRQMADLLKKNHRPQHPTYERGLYERYRSKITGGARCPDCFESVFFKRHTGWYCSLCRKKTLNAGTLALTDYALIVAPYISNREARNFLGEPDRYTMYRILEKQSLRRHIQKNRKMIYDIRPLYQNLH